MFPVSDENPTRTYPVVNHLLIFANIMAFIAQFLFLQGAAGELLERQLMVVPARFLNHFSLTEFGTILSSMFMHGGLSHIFGNLWYLYIFGDNVEDRVGHTNYFLFYLCCGILADLAHIISDPSSTVPSLGASGAISGVLGAYLVLFPGVKVNTWVTWYFRPKLDAWILIGFWFVLQVLSSVFSDVSGGGTAWFAHIGGFVGGIILLKFVLKDNERRTGSPYSYANVEKLPLPPFIAAFLVLYGLAAIGFSAYQHHAFRFQTAPVLQPSGALPQPAKPSDYSAKPAVSKPASSKPVSSKPVSSKPASHKSSGKHNHKGKSASSNGVKSNKRAAEQNTFGD